MGLRWLVGILIVEAFLSTDASASNSRPRRQSSHQRDSPYQPPLLLNSPSNPVASSATIQNSYQPPISLIRSNEYQVPQQTSYSVHHQPQQQQPKVYTNNQQHYPLPPPSYSVHQHQQPPQQSYSVYQQPPSSSQFIPPPQTNLATSYSVHQQPAPPVQSNSRQPFAIFSDNSGGVQGLPQSTAERTYSTHSKVVGSSHVPAQAIHKAPASEIQSDKGSLAKEKDNKNDEYVVYYYYYYDNDTAPNNNLSLNFDDIPSLEAYDNENTRKEPEKSASARTLAANVNSLTPVVSEPKRDSIQNGESSSSQPRSASGADRDSFSRGDRHNSPLADTVVQPLKPVSNVFRYGSNEVPRFPVLPNFIVSEAPTTRPGDHPTPDTLSSELPTTQASQQSSHLPDLNRNEEHENDDFNNVLDHSSDDRKSDDDKAANEDIATTTQTDPPTTTEISTTTTTEKSRRRPPIGGGRRRFNSSPSFAPNRSRQTPTRGSTSSTSSTTSTTTATPTRGSFRGSNRLRPRPSIAGNRPRPQLGSRNAENGEESNRVAEATTSSTTTTASSRSRFTTSAAPRRFQSSRSRSTSSTSSTTSTTRSPPRARPSTRPRPNPITRNRPPRPGFLRPRPGSEPEEPETTTTPAEPSATEEETSPSGEETSSTDNSEDNGTEEDVETSEEETEEPTTTEGNRFSALFRPRNRNALGNRPRPVIGSRPARS